MDVEALRCQAWESLAWVGVDAATCAFGDASALGPGFQLTSVGNESSFRVQDFTQEGFPLIAYVTMEDAAMEVEVLRDEAGAIVAARMVQNVEKTRSGVSTHPLPSRF